MQLCFSLHGVEMLSTLKTKYKSWKDARFLKKHHCETWEQYHHNNDPDVSYRASRIVDYYQGYPWVYCIDQRSHYAYDLLYDNGPGGYRYGYHDIMDWCRSQCKGKIRGDFHRVYQQPWDGEWHFNEIGGGDYIFIAFKSERDYNWFVLRWA